MEGKSFMGVKSQWDSLTQVMGGKDTKSFFTL